MKNKARGIWTSLLSLVGSFIVAEPHFTRNDEPWPQWSGKWRHTQVVEGSILIETQFWEDIKKAAEVVDLCPLYLTF